MARVNALHKKGPLNMLDNYRPISVLPVVSKVFERILYKQLVEYLDAENFKCYQSINLALGAPTPLFRPYLTVRMNGIATWIVAFIT